MAEELLVVLNRKDNSGFGFSLLGKPGLPPIIYNIIDNSPAAESGEVEVGDVILKINETDVNKFSTKEVLKCLRLSSDPVTLKIKRDPKVKTIIKKHLLSPSGDVELMDIRNKGAFTSVYRNSRPEPAVHQPNIRTNGTCSLEEEALLADQFPEDERLQWEPLSSDIYKPKGPPKFEAYMMTGEHILNISRTQQINLLPKQQKKLENLRYRNSHSHHQRYQHNSVPNSPNEMEMGLRTHKSNSNSANTSPVSANKRDINVVVSESTKQLAFNSHSFVRTSRSEDQLQMQKDSSISAVDIDIEDDVTSSLNTLLDTRPEVSSNSNSSNNVCSSTKSDRIVWTYNAPVTTSLEQHKQCCQSMSNGSTSSHSNSSPSSPSPLRSRSDSPASPTSVSSSIMSSHSGSCRLPYTITNSLHSDTGQLHRNGDFSISEAISNISSPDYHDDNSMGIRDCVMEISDHSDSDSTLLVSEPRQRHGSNVDCDHRIVIQVKGPDKDLMGLKDRSKNWRDENRIKSKLELLTEQEMGSSRDDVTEEGTTLKESGKSTSSPPSSEDDSDIESLHSFHYSPKAVDLPSAERLAKRLYCLDGFKKSDVSRHLSKNNDFSRAVADEYLKYFGFEHDSLDIALRKFLKQFSLTGETQERERVLVHFSKRYLDCNPGSFNSQDAVHTLTCAIMLLNTDLHGQNVNRKMTCNEFIENLAGLNECENFPREILKQLFHAIKNYPLEWALDEEVDESGSQVPPKAYDTSNLSGNPFLDIPNCTNAVEYKKGYVMRKCCYDTNAKRTPFHKRSWKMFYCTLRDQILYLHKDENGFRKNQMSDNLHNAIRIHHSLATKAADYTKKQYVFRLQTADQAEYLFQTSDSKELQSWIDTINFVSASLSAQPLEAAVGSQKKFQRPLLPCSRTKLTLREQLHDHEERVMRLENELDEHQKNPPERGSKSLVIQNYKEKEIYLNYEFKRYKTYAYILRSRLSQYPDVEISLAENLEELDEASGVALLDGSSNGIVPPPIPERQSPITNRHPTEKHYVPSP